MRFAKTIAGLGISLTLACLAQSPYHNSLVWRANQWINRASADTATNQYQFIAVATGTNRYNYSADGTNWSSDVFTNGAIYTAAGFLNNTYIASPAPGTKILYALSYTNWIPGTAVTSGYYIRGAYGNGTYVLIQNGARNVVTSTDGTNWYAQANVLPPVGTPYYQDCAFGAGKFITVCSKVDAGNSYNKYAASVDGTNWAELTFPVTRYFTRIAYGAGNWVAAYSYTNINDVGASANGILYSPDGTNWVQTQLPTSAAWTDMSFGGNAFVIVASYSYAGSGTRMAINGASFDGGTNWGSYALGAATNWQSVAYSGGKWVVIVQDSPLAVISTDAQNWATISMANSLTWMMIRGK